MSEAQQKDRKDRQGLTFINKILKVNRVTTKVFKETLKGENGEIKQVECVKLGKKDGLA